MPTDFKKILSQAFNQASVGYDNPALKFFDIASLALVDKLELHGDERIVDMSSGTGKIALLLAQKLPKGRVTAVDISQGMLAQAKKKASAMGLNNIDFVCSDVDKWQFEKSSYDGLTCGFGVHFWANMEQSLGHALGSLKKGAFVATSSFAKSSFEPQSILCLNLFKRYGAKLPDSYTWERLDSEQKNINFLSSVKLGHIKTHLVDAGHPIDASKDWWDLVLYTGFRAFFDKLSIEDQKKFEDEHKTQIEAMAEENKNYLKVPVIISLAKKV